MNDYTRIVDISNPRVICLNSDTVVFLRLVARQVYRKPVKSTVDYVPIDQKSHDTSHYFNVTEN